MALVPQIVDVVEVPVIAAGGIGDARGIAAAFALEALRRAARTGLPVCPEAKISPVHRDKLRSVRDGETARRQRLHGTPGPKHPQPLGDRAWTHGSSDAPEFPLASDAVIAAAPGGAG